MVSNGILISYFLLGQIQCGKGNIEVVSSTYVFIVKDQLFLFPFGPYMNCYRVPSS